MTLTPNEKILIRQLEDQRRDIYDLQKRLEVEIHHGTRQNKIIVIFMKHMKHLDAENQRVIQLKLKGLYEELKQKHKGPL